MKRFLAIFCVTIYLAALVKPVSPLIYYFLHENYIAHHLCVNRDKPQMHCNGKCYLAKTLRKAEKQSKKGPINSSRDFPVVFFEMYSLHFNNWSRPSKTAFIHYSNYHFTIQKPVFHPPKQIVV